MTSGPVRFQLLGYAAQLGRPELLPLVALALLAALIVAYGILMRRRVLTRLTTSPRLTRKLAPGLSFARIALRGALLSLGLLLVALALLGLSIGERSELVKRRGIDLIFAIDASRSMLARDVLPSRLERAKLELVSLIDRLQGDRVGIVVFAGQAFVQCPLTTDYGAAKLFLRAIDPEAMPTQGTALAQALTTASTMFRAADRGAKAKAVLLLSDGEDHEGDLEDARKRLEEDGAQIFALGLGSRAGAPIPLTDQAGRVVGYRRDRAGQTVMTRLEDKQLRELAQATGGRYVAGEGSDLGMDELVEALGRLEKSDFESRLSVQYADVYEYLALPGFLFLLAASIVRERRGKR